MSKSLQDQLFELIKSLSKSEKRYFKLLSTRHTIGEENNYILLFDFIDKQAEYNEVCVYRHFKGEAFLNKFSITKKRLYDHILAALDGYYAHSSIDAQLYKALNSADILYNKSLYEQSERLLISANKLALKHQRFIVQLEVTKRLMRLNENKGHSALNITDIQQIVSESSIHIQHISTHIDFWALKSELFIELSRHGSSRNDEQLAAFKTIYEKLNQNSDIHQLSVENHYLFQHIKSTYFYAINDFQNCMTTLELTISLFHTHPTYLEMQPNSYFSVLTNAIYVSEKLNNFKRADELFEQLKNVPQKILGQISEDLEIKLFSSISSIEISSHTRRGDYDSAKRLIEKISNGIERFGDKLSSQRKAFLMFKCAAVLVGIGDYYEALKWTNGLLNNAELSGNEDIISYTQILNLIIHIELKHDHLLPYALKNTERFLKSRNAFHPFEKLLLKFICKLTKVNHSLDEITVWEEFHTALFKIKFDSNENNGSEYFDFESWTKAKIEHKNFTEIARLRFLEVAS